MSSDARPDGFVRSLERGLAVLQAFSRDQPVLTISDAARHTGLTRAAARRFLHTLHYLGYVTRYGDGFSLGPRTLDLGYSFLSGLPLRDIAIPYMMRIVAEVQESCVLSILDGVDVIEVAQLPSNRILAVSFPVGSRFPAHLTSGGRMLLADLPDHILESTLKGIRLERRTKRSITDSDLLLEALKEAKAQRWTVVDEELEDHIRSIAVPLCDAGGITIAALSVWSNGSRVSLQELRSHVLPQLREAASRIDQALATGDHRTGPRHMPLPD